MARNLIPEDQLCLLLARGRFSPDVARRAVERLEAGPRWDLLLERAATHGLIPLVYHRLRALDFRGVPPSAVRHLRDTFGVNAIRNELLTQELVSVLTRLGESGVPVIPLKGIALAESLYGDPALRACADLDILIPPKHLAETLRVLRSSGYTDRFGEPSLVRLLARYGKDCGLMRQDGRTLYPLQVHCGLIWGGSAERRLLAEIWSHAAPRPFHGAPAYSMGPEWEFLYLAVHAARHGLYPFKWLVDIDWLVLQNSVDWVKVGEAAKWMGWERILQSCLAACAALFETPVPMALAEIAHSPSPRISVSKLGPLGIPRQTLFGVRLLPTLTAKLRFLATRLVVPTPADCELLRLPSSLFCLYYFMRPLRLTITVVRWTVQSGITRLRGFLHRHGGESLPPA